LSATGERLSERLKKYRHMLGYYHMLDEFDSCIEQAHRMESEIDSWPKRRTEDPSTSYFDGSIESLRLNQNCVLQVFVEAMEPLDDVTLERLYSASGFKTQAPSGIRTRRRELLRFGLLKLIDKKGKSPSGRRACRWQVVEWEDGGTECQL